jgi:peptidyl-prolyl cis-trans isomerase SurA
MGMLYRTAGSGVQGPGPGGARSSPREPVRRSAATAGRVVRRVAGLGLAVGGCFILSRPAAAQAGASQSKPADSAVVAPDTGSRRPIIAPTTVSGSVRPDSVPGVASSPGTPGGAGSPANGSVNIKTEAAVGGTIAADSIPAFAPTPSAAAATTAAGAPAPAESRADSLRDSLANVERLASLYPTTVTVPLDRVAAVVGDEPILWSDVIERINVERAQGLQVPTDSAEQMVLARNVTNELVNEELLVQKAKDLKVEVADEDVMPAVDDQIKRVRATFSSDAEFRNALKKAGFGNAEEYRKTLIDQQKRQELQRKVIQEMKEDGKLIPVGVSESDITDAFNKTKSQLPRRPATVTFRQIMITPKPTPEDKAAAKAKADSILAELKKNGSSADQFAQMAKRESMDLTTKEQGGDLGWERRGIMVPEFDRWMFALAPGQLSPVIETVFGFHIIRVNRRQPSEVDASHILIRWKIDTGDVLRAHQLADSVLAAWKAGANFDTLVVHFHDPFEEKGALQPFPRDSLPPDYAAAFAGKKAGDFVNPFPVPDRGTGHWKFVIAQILTSDDGGDYTLNDWRVRIHDQLADERAIGRLLDELRKDTYVQIRI